MAEVQAFKLPGVKMWFPSGDHTPAHFHARRRGEWEVRVYLQEAPGSMIKIIRPPDARIKGKDRKAIESGVEAHLDELLQEWEQCQRK